MYQRTDYPLHLPGTPCVIVMGHPCLIGKFIVSTGKPGSTSEFSLDIGSPVRTLAELICAEGYGVPEIFERDGERITLPSSFVREWKEVPRV